MLTTSGTVLTISELTPNVAFRVAAVGVSQKIGPFSNPANTFELGEFVIQIVSWVKLMYMHFDYTGAISMCPEESGNIICCSGNNFVYLCTTLHELEHPLILVQMSLNHAGEYFR